MEFFARRPVALFCCIIMIAASILIGSGASLDTLRSQAEAEFHTGPLRADLEELAGQCYNLTVIAKRYLPEDEPAIAGLLASRDALRASNAPATAYAAQQELADRARTLRHQLSGLALDERDISLADKCEADIESTLHKISGNRYNTAALDYNQTIRNFPGNVLGGLTGASPLELYQ